MDQAIISLVTKFDGYGMALYILVTTVIAGFLSSIVGIDREIKGHAAGLRTHVLITIACSMMMSISIYAISAATTGQGMYETLTYDASRIASSILAGIGFMGAGTIVKNGLSIKGLTTASTIWLCAAIGMACGAGYILEAIIVTAVAMAFLIGLAFIEKELDKHSPYIVLKVAPNVPILHELRSEAEKFSVIIKNVVSENLKNEDGTDCVSVTVFFAFQTDPAAIEDFCDRFRSYPYVYSVEGKQKKKKKKES